MKKLQKIFENSRNIRGKCPKVGIETNMEYKGISKTSHSEIDIKYEFRCPICNSYHYLRQIEDLKLDL